LIPSEVTRAVPTKACFSTHPQIISVVQTWEAQEPPIAPKRVSCKPISVLGAYLTFFYKNNRPIFQTFQNRRNSGSRYFKPSRTARFSPKNQWLFDVLKWCVCGQWIMYQKNQVLYF
jgi:hypothetical protein